MNNKEEVPHRISSILGESLFLRAMYALKFKKTEIKISTGDEDYFENIDFFIKEFPIEVSSNQDYHTAKKNTGKAISLFLPKYANQKSMIYKSDTLYKYQNTVIRTNHFDAYRFVDDLIDMNREVVGLYKVSKETGITVFPRDRVFKRNFNVSEISERRIGEIEDLLSIFQDQMDTTLEPSSTTPSTNLPVPV